MTDIIMPTCPDCGKLMKIKIGPYGAFYGCSDYPHCKRTRQMPSDLKLQAEHDLEKRWMTTNHGQKFQQFKPHREANEIYFNGNFPPYEKKMPTYSVTDGVNNDPDVPLPPTLLHAFLKGE